MRIAVRPKSQGWREQWGKHSKDRISSFAAQGSRQAMLRQVARLVEGDRHSAGFRSYSAAFGNGEIAMFAVDANASGSSGTSEKGWPVL